MSFSHADRDVVASFAGQLGVPAKPGPDGSYAFRFAEDGVLTIVAAEGGERVCMTLERAGHHRDEARRRALSGAGYDAALGLVTHACCVADGSLLYTVAFEGGTLTLPGIESALQALLSKARG